MSNLGPLYFLMSSVASCSAHFDSFFSPKYPENACYQSFFVRVELFDPMDIDWDWRLVRMHSHFYISMDYVGIMLMRHDHLKLALEARRDAHRMASDRHPT